MNGKCEVCKNEYDNVMQISLGDQKHIFDSLECAIQALAPTCGNCKCRVIGHGVEAEGIIYCCANCARAKGHLTLVDHEQPTKYSPNADLAQLS